MKKDNHKPALARMALLWARLYYAFAKEITDQLGNDEGKRLLIDCIKKFADIRGKAIAKYVHENNLPYDVESFIKYYDSPWSEIQEACISLFPDEDKNLKPAMGTTFCPYLKIWESLPSGKEFALIYCEEFHKAMWASYHEQLRVRQDKIMSRGDDICTFDTYMEGQEDKSMPIFDQK
ncbi:MAG: L-2-amino-thiazoline-4-carboxylic acid hydrolase [Spirochaetales bacterium]|nr:L-2-amino-thiazoline-4-carboxylic acid hydrolase [Spirochaetales bacterium]